jgi:thiol-disulfide isomerase/thioredoxin
MNLSPGFGRTLTMAIAWVCLWSIAPLQAQSLTAADISSKQLSPTANLVVSGRFLLPQGDVKPMALGEGTYRLLRLKTIPAPNGNGLDHEILTADGYDFKPQTDGSFRIKGVEPGRYQLSARVYVPVEKKIRPMAVTRVPVIQVRRDYSYRTVQLTWAKDIVAGDLAPSIDAKTMAGKKWTLADKKGEYVLLSFCATFCGPCHREHKFLKEVAQKYLANAQAAAGATPRFSMVSFWLDRDLDRPEKFIKNKPSNWPQVHLGQWGIERVSKRYNIRSIPSIWLIGPDGRIVAKNLRGEKIAESIQLHIDSDRPKK